MKATICVAILYGNSNSQLVKIAVVNLVCTDDIFIGAGLVDLGCRGCSLSEIYVIVECNESSLNFSVAAGSLSTTGPMFIDVLCSDAHLSFLILFLLVSFSSSRFYVDP